MNADSYCGYCEAHKTPHFKGKLDALEEGFPILGTIDNLDLIILFLLEVVLCILRYLAAPPDSTQCQ